MKEHFNYKHGLSRDSRYKVAERIMSRCNNINAKDYKYYGGRGIECKIGSSILEVTKTLLSINGHSKGVSIDRINNDMHYSIDNIKWSTKKEQRLNQRFIRDKLDYDVGKSPVARGNFRATCIARGWNFNNFIEIKSNETNSGGKVKKFNYVYKNKEVTSE